MHLQLGGGRERSRREVRMVREGGRKEEVRMVREGEPFHSFLHATEGSVVAMATQKTATVTRVHGNIHGL